MKFEYHRDKETLFNVMNNKAKKKNIVVRENNNKVEITLEQGKFDADATAVPVTFKGKIVENENACEIEGKFTFGFYLYTMVVVAVVLIVARFLWSAYKIQTENMVLCGVAAVILVIVVAVTIVKAAKPKEIITEFLNEMKM